MSAMKPRYRVSREAIEHIKRFEGYRRRSAQLPAGGWTIGYGHTLTAREGAEVSESDAEALLLYDLIAVAHAVNEHVFAPLTQNQFDALCAFAFNIGVENFQRSSVLRRLNEGQLLQAASAMELWRKAEFEGERIVIDALVRRRSVEKTLFLTPPRGFVPAPTPILPPSVDMDATGVVPRQVPTALTVALDGDHAVVQRDEAPAPVAYDEEETASPTRAAAEAVTSRLSTIFAEPEPAVAAPETESGTEAAGFALTPPEEDFSPEALNRIPAPPEPANESGPSLFDPQLLVANDHDAPEIEAPPEVEAAPEPEPTEAFPETTSGPVADEAVAESDVTPNDAIVLPIGPDRVPAESAVSALLPPAILAVVGVGIFSGGVLSGVNNLPTLAWIASLIGIGLFAVAVYLLLDRLGQVEDEDDLDSDEDDETRDQ